MPDLLFEIICGDYIIYLVGFSGEYQTIKAPIKQSADHANLEYSGNTRDVT